VYYYLLVVVSQWVVGRLSLRNPRLDLPYVPETASTCSTVNSSRDWGRERRSGRLVLLPCRARSDRLTTRAVRSGRHNPRLVVWAAGRRVGMQILMGQLIDPLPEIKFMV